MNDIINIEKKILVIRDQQVMLDRDLAELYGVETKVLNQAVKRNIERFPEQFMFQLSIQEHIFLRSQIVTSKTETRGGRQYLPYVFTEQGVAMRRYILANSQVLQRLDRIETKMRFSFSFISRFNHSAFHQNG